MYGTESTERSRVAYTNHEALCVKFPTDVILPEGTPVKFDSNGKLVAAENAMAIGLVEVPKGNDDRQTVALNACTVQVFSNKVVLGLTAAATAAGAELKFTGIDTATGHMKFAVAASGEVVAAIAGVASTANGVNTKVVMLTGQYKKA